MSNHRIASRHGVTILPGNVVTIPDGRNGVVEEIDGTTLVVEVPRPRASRVAVLGGIDDLVETVCVEAPLVAHAA